MLHIQMLVLLHLPSLSFTPSSASPPSHSQVLYIQMLVFVIVEHLLMLLKMLLAYVIPDSPRWVVDATARAEFSKAVKKDHKQRRLTIDGMNDADLKRRKDAKAAKLKADIDAQKLRLNDPTDGSSKARSMSGFV